MRLSPRRPVTSYLRVRRLISFAIRNRRFQIARLKNRSCPYLNIGCGTNIFPDFINIDSAWRPGIDLCWDITRPMPFTSETMAGAYTEHCLEHLSHTECLGVLKDLHRLLRFDGTARIVVPDAGMYLTLYCKAQGGENVDFPELEDADQGREGPEAKAGPTPMILVNKIFRDYGHKYAYDFETLQSMLLLVGFREVFRRAFRDGRDPHLLIDTEYRRPQSLYLEAVK